MISLKKMTKIKTIKDLLSDYFKGSELKNINEIINLSKIWNKVVGKTISKNTEIVSIIKGDLLIKTTTPVWSKIETKAIY